MLSIITLLVIYTTISPPTLYDVEIGDNKNFMSRYLMRVTITIIDIIMISLNGTTDTNIGSTLLMSMFLSNESYDNHSIYGNIMLMIL